MYNYGKITNEEIIIGLFKIAVRNYRSRPRNSSTARELHKKINYTMR
jgi:hypothetical protein